MAMGFFPAIVAEGITCVFTDGKFAANFSARLSVARCTAQPRAFSSCAKASAGNRCPPVPPAASSAILSAKASYSAGIIMAELRRSGCIAIRL